MRSGYRSTWILPLNKLKFWEITIFIFTMRMHSSKMGIVHCSGHLSCHKRMPPPRHTCPLPCMPPCHAYPPCHTHPLGHTCPLPCMPPCLAYPLCHACSPRHTCPLPCMTPCHACSLPPAPMDRVLDTYLWKHYLSATTVADGINMLIFIRQS